MSDPHGARIATALGVVACVLLIIFALPTEVFFFVALVLFCLATEEFVRLARHWSPNAPLRVLLVGVPVCSIGLVVAVRQDLTAGWSPVSTVLACACLVIVTVTLLVLLTRTPITEAAVTIGLLTFALPYFVTPVVSVYLLHRVDPHLIFLLILQVMVSDAAGYGFGTLIGRHKLAPVVSPKKTWEGAIAGVVLSVAAAVIWSLIRLGHVTPGFVVLATVIAFVAPLGDLVESLFKRGAGVKDSAHILPGHGGFFDRLDATILSAPVFLLGAWILGFETFLP